MSREMKHIFWGRFSINKKFIVSLLIILIIPLFGLFIWINENVTSELEQQNLITGLEILKQTRTPINYLIDDTIFLTTQVIGNENLQTYLKSQSHLENSKDSQMKLDLQFELGNLVASREYINRLSIYDHRMIHFQFGGFLVEEPTTYREQVNALKGKPLWLAASLNESYITISDRNYEVSVMRTINNHDILNDIIGYEVLSISEDYISSLYDGIAGESTINMFIINEQGDIVSSIDKSLLGSKLPDASYLPLLLDKEDGFFQTGDTIVSHYRIRETNWHMIKEDDKTILSERGIFNSIILICILLTLIFGILFITLQHRYIIRPVIRLKEDMSKINDGQYNIDLHSTANDEIGDLNIGLIEMSNRIQSLIETEYKLKIQEKEAQLQFLQSQINPHFLYNTLDSLRWMALKAKQKDLAKQIQALSNHFRHSLNQGREMTTVGEEVKHLHDYLMIQKHRFGDILQTSIHVGEGIESIPVLNLILQPLVENAIVHGLENKLDDWHVWVSVSYDGHYLTYEVRDNGMGVDQDLIRTKLTGQGSEKGALALNNVNKRIKYKYGESYGLDFYSRVGQGTRVVIKVPVEREVLE